MRKIYIDRPRFEDGNALRLNITSSNPVTLYDAYVMLRESSDDADTIKELASKWADGDIEPTSDDFHCLSEIIDGFSKAMMRTVQIIRKEVPDVLAKETTLGEACLRWGVYAETRGDGMRMPGRMGALPTREDAEQYAKLLTANGWGGVTVKEIV